MEGKVFNTRDDLFHAVEEAFYALPNQYIPNLNDSIPRRLFAVIGSRGGQTKY